MNVKKSDTSIRPIKEKPRKGWASAFAQMHKNQDDQQIIDDQIDLDNTDWDTNSCPCQFLDK